MIALAPMDGVTDHVYRALFTSRARRGRRALTFCVSEFIRVSSHPLPGSVIARHCPEVLRDGHTPAGVPVMVQLLGGQPEPIARTAMTAIELGAYGIDLNFGCPAKTVNRHDGGASLLKAPERIEAIVGHVRRVVPRDRPVSVKIRLGWESHDEVVPIAQAAERGGASWLTIHGRTRLELYGPPADHHSIGRARRAISIPTIANGDLNEGSSITMCQAASGCSSFMLGRGPMGRPSLVCGTEGQSAEAERQLLADVLLEYVDCLATAGSSEGRQVARVKQWLMLGSRANPDITPMFERVKRIRTTAELRADLQGAQS